jgi:hypothetical protein
VSHGTYLDTCGDFLNNPESVIDWMAPHAKIKPAVEAALEGVESFTHTVIGPSLFSLRMIV